MGFSSFAKITFETLGDLTLRGQDTSSIDELTHRRIREVTVVILAVIVVGIPFVIQYYTLNVPIMSVFVSCTIFLGGMILLWLRRSKNPELAGLFGTIIMFMLVLTSNWCSGGFYDPNFGWLYVLPIIAALMINARMGLVFTVLVFLLTTGFWLLTYFGYEPPNLIPKTQHAAQSLANRLSAIVTIGIFLWALHSQRQFIEMRLVAMNEDLRKEAEKRSILQHKAELAQQEAEQANAVKDRFLANLSHELRTPLNAIIGYTEMIQEDYFDNEMLVEDTEKVLSSAHNLYELINQVLELTNLEGGRVKPIYDSIELSTFIEKLVLDQTPIITKQNNTFQWQIKTTLSEVQSDERILRQILVGLLNNAGKFTTDGEVYLNVYKMESFLVFDVEDTGVGIEQEHILRIFELFTQADDTSTREYDGLGLGLALCHKLANVLQAQLEVESVVGQGSRFRLKIPVA